jgi:hypothetical protein
MKLTQFKIRQWHSINLLPSISIVSIADDDPPYNIIGRKFELTWFGVIIDITIPSKKFRLARYAGPVGPVWSRRRRQWYYINRIEN